MHEKGETPKIKERAMLYLVQKHPSQYHHKKPPPMLIFLLVYQKRKYSKPAQRKRLGWKFYILGASYESL